MVPNLFISMERQGVLITRNWSFFFIELLHKPIFLMDHTLLGEEESFNYPSIYEKNIPGK